MLHGHERAGLVVERHGESAGIRGGRLAAIANQGDLYLAQAVAPGGEGLLNPGIALWGGQGRVQPALGRVLGHDRPAQVSPDALAQRAERGQNEHQQQGDAEHGGHHRSGRQ